MINVSEIITDPDFAQSYSVKRYTGNWVGGKFVETSEVLNFFGPVTVASVRDVQLLPEGDRITGVMAFHTLASQPFRTSDEEGTSDQILWRGDYYKILQLSPYDDYGYQKALATRIGGV